MPILTLVLRLKAGRLVAAVIGLVSLAIAYTTGSVLFLALAVVAFVGGLYLMRTNKRPVQKEEEKNVKGRSARK